MTMRQVGGLVLLATVLASCTSARAAAAGREAARCAGSPMEVYERASSSVVFISATSINPYQLSERLTRVVGSGVIIDGAGLILTNSHVVFGRQTITVTLDDGTRLPAELVGADPILDLAVIRVSSPKKALPTARLGDSEGIRVGQEVVVIGNPLGLDQSLTRGVVSAVNRVLPDVPFSVFEPLIQTDAAINPGNSGGPLLNLCSDVVGITTLIIQGASNIGFAIPINLARSVVPQLVADGRVIRPWLGFHGQVIDGGIRAVLRLPLVDGFLIEAVEPGSPAERAGLKGGHLEIAVSGREVLVGGDIVTAVNGTRPSSPEALVDLMRGLKVGGRVSLTVFRDGDYRAVEYDLPERPLQPGDLPGRDGTSAGPSPARREILPVVRPR